VLLPGRSRAHLQHTLSAAYAHGLLSEETFIARVDALASPVIDPARLIGDLRLGPTRPRRPWRALARLRAMLDRPDDSRSATQLLALDWDGGCAELLIGRHLDCDVVLGDASVSRRHARLRFRDGRWILQDLQSINGTTVNGARVGRCELRPGDRIRIGPDTLTVD
jgi:hypothetical protein